MVWSGEREEAGERTDAEGYDEDQRIDDFRHGARDLGEAAKKEIDPDSWPARLREAGKHSRKPPIAPNSVAISAIRMVSNRSCSQLKKP